MKKYFSILLWIFAVLGAAPAAPFTEPKAHPINRYETGWEKNPFTLKTAPVALNKESFAKDLALAGWRRAGDDNIIILVNIKTREYSRLKNQEPAADGTKVKTAHLENRRSETFVELERNNETAVVRYDESYLHQMAAQGGGANPNPQMAMRGQNNPGMIITPPNMPQQPNSSAPNIVPTGTQAPRPGMVPPAPKLPSPQPGVSPANNVPTVQRRRLNTLPQPTLPQPSQP
ncbi:MAG: hypothetical protein K8R87_03185 [Verrucomicrobia bacterium]|nr:hypothetical protein [Verrucomicrobiota bacterium]